MMAGRFREWARTPRKTPTNGHMLVTAVVTAVSNGVTTSLRDKRMRELESRIDTLEKIHKDTLPKFIEELRRAGALR